jgi:hypothetical protein
MSYSERYTRLNARKKVGDLFNFKKKTDFPVDKSYVYPFLESKAETF